VDFGKRTRKKKMASGPGDHQLPSGKKKRGVADRGKKDESNKKRISAGRKGDLLARFSSKSTQGESCKGGKVLVGQRINKRDIGGAIEVLSGKSDYAEDWAEGKGSISTRRKGGVCRLEEPES